MNSLPGGTNGKAAKARSTVVVLLCLLLVCLMVLAVLISMRAALAEEAGVSVSVRVASSIRITGGTVRANIPVVRQISDGFVTYLVP